MTNPNGAPSIPEGSLVVVDPDYGNTYDVNGKIVVAQIMGSTEATLKKFVIDGPIKYLVPLNPNYRVLGGQWELQNRWCSSTSYHRPLTHRADFNIGLFLHLDVSFPTFNIDTKR